jgi:NhaP-type Na+/H+ or K+/H+ antiporter
MLACVLSATDTVAAVSIVKAEKYPKLNSILFGEGVINDAVSIVLLRAVQSIFQGNVETEMGMWAALLVFLNFVYISICSILLGIFFGLLCSFTLKKVRTLRKNPMRETLLIFLYGYLSYIIAELVQMSGIMTIFCCGLAMAHYAKQNLSAISYEGSDLSFKVVAHGAEAFTFTYLGLTVITLETE